jgi:hypothetical protein
MQLMVPFSSRGLGLPPKLRNYFAGAAIQEMRPRAMKTVGVFEKAHDQQISIFRMSDPN